MTPSNFLGSLRSEIDSTLALSLDGIRRDYARHSAEGIVDEVIRATLPKGGRIRPLLCCLGYAAVGGEGGALDARIVRAAASLELLHTFALIHDDVMDGSPMRRGEPAIHKRLADERVASGGRDAELHGISIAILAGDLALVVSDLLFAQSGFRQDALVRAYGPLSAMRLDAIAGQYLDLTHSGQPTSNPELAGTIGTLKTASYSVEGPLLVGATLGEASGPAVDALRSYGRALGEAFQLADDLNGVFGDPAATGKDAENDIRRGKPTGLIASALLRAGPQAERTIRKVWGNPDGTDEDLEQLRVAVRESGAADDTRCRIRSLVAEAGDALNAVDSGLAREPCTILSGLASIVAQRSD